MCKDAQRSLVAHDVDIRVVHIILRTITDFASPVHNKCHSSISIHDYRGCSFRRPSFASTSITVKPGSKMLSCPFPFFPIFLAPFCGQCCRCRAVVLMLPPIFPLHQSLKTVSVFLRFSDIWSGCKREYTCRTSGKISALNDTCSDESCDYAGRHSCHTISDQHVRSDAFCHILSINKPILISRKDLNSQSPDWFIILPPSFPPSICSRLIVFMFLKCFYLSWNILKLIQQAFWWETARQVQTAKHSESRRFRFGSIFHKTKSARGVAIAGAMAMYCPDVSSRSLKSWQTPHMTFDRSHLVQNCRRAQMLQAPIVQCVQAAFNMSRCEGEWVGRMQCVSHIHDFPIFQLGQCEGTTEQRHSFSFSVKQNWMTLSLCTEAGGVSHEWSHCNSAAHMFEVARIRLLFHACQ